MQTPKQIRKIPRAPYTAHDQISDQISEIAGKNPAMGLALRDTFTREWRRFRFVNMFCSSARGIERFALFLADRNNKTNNRLNSLFGYLEKQNTDMKLMYEKLPTYYSIMPLAGLDSTTGIAAVDAMALAQNDIHNSRRQTERLTKIRNARNELGHVVYTLYSGMAQL